MVLHLSLMNFKNFYKFTAPYNPQTNGQAEKFVQTLKDAIKKMCYSNRNIKAALVKMLSQYRIMPHMGTGKAPAELMFNRKIRCHLDLLRPEKLIKNNVNSNIKTRSFNVNDRVSCRNYIGKNKWNLGKIVKVLGKLHYEILLDNGTVRKCHVNQICKVGEELINREMELSDLDNYYILPDDQIKVLNNAVSQNSNNNDLIQNDAQAQINNNDNEPRVLRNRQSLQKPIKFNDFVVEMPRKNSRNK